MHNYRMLKIVAKSLVQAKVERHVIDNAIRGVVEDEKAETIARATRKAENRAYKMLDDLHYEVNQMEMAGQDDPIILANERYGI